MSGEVDIDVPRVTERRIYGGWLMRLFTGIRGRVQAGAVTERELADRSIDPDRLDGTLRGQIALTAGCVTTDKLADEVFAASAFGRGKMEDGYVQDYHVADGAFEADQFQDGIVTAGMLAAGALSGQSDVDTLSARVELSAGGWEDCGLSVTLTPGSTSSKFLVLAHITAGYDRTNHANAAAIGIRFKREGTVFGGGTGSGSRAGVSGLIVTDAHALFTYVVGSGMAVAVDAPGSTDPQEYTVETYLDGTGSYYLGGSSGDTNLNLTSRTVCALAVLEVK